MRMHLLFMTMPAQLRFRFDRSTTPQQQQRHPSRFLVKSLSFKLRRTEQLHYSFGQTVRMLITVATDPICVRWPQQEVAAYRYDLWPPARSVSRTAVTAALAEGAI